MKYIKCRRTPSLNFPLPGGTGRLLGGCWFSSRGPELVSPILSTPTIHKKKIERVLKEITCYSFLTPILVRFFRLHLYKTSFSLRKITFLRFSKLSSRKLFSSPHLSVWALFWNHSKSNFRYFGGLLAPFGTSWVLFMTLACSLRPPWGASLSSRGPMNPLNIQNDPLKVSKRHPNCTHNK